MPFDAAKIYTLPPIYNVVATDDILTTQLTTPLEDIRDALNSAFYRDGVVAMTGGLKLIDGAVAAPALKFASAPTTGIFYDPAIPEMVLTVGGVKAVRIPATGIANGLPIGTPVPVLDDILPPLCIWADGRNVSRTTYADLFARWATKYGAGDGSTTFGIPNLRGVPLVGRDNIGGTDAGLLTGVPVVSGSRLTTGSVIGSTTHALTGAQNGPHTHTGTTTSDSPTNPTYVGYSGGVGGVSGVNFTAPNSASAFSTQVAGSMFHSHNFTTNSDGSGAAHNNVQRSFLCNFAIYAGA